MDFVTEIDVTQRLLHVEQEDNGVLVTFADGLSILFSGKRLRTCAFAHDSELSPVEKPS